jgi:5-bromo-4-chloroindolyl phosphate hydrolysis protein
MQRYYKWWKLQMEVTCQKPHIYCKKERIKEKKKTNEFLHIMKRHFKSIKKNPHRSLGKKLNNIKKKIKKKMR